MDSFVNGVLTGLMGGLGALLAYHTKFAVRVQERLTKIEVKVTNICSRLEKIEQRLNNIDDILRDHGERIARLEKNS